MLAAHIRIIAYFGTEFFSPADPGAFARQSKSKRADLAAQCSAVDRSTQNE
jgi:hypothetical protein